MGFIGRGEDDGRPGRQYRGKPQPLGALTEWKCPSCGGTVSQAYELGCNLCGAGQPDTRPVQEPQPAAPADWVQPPAQGPSAGPSRPKVVERLVVRPEAALVVTRIIQYVCTDISQQAAMELTLQRSLVGRVGFAWGEIVSGIVDEVSPRQQDILSLAKRQPGVWLGGPSAADRATRVEQWMNHGEPAFVPEPILRYEEAPGREEHARAIPYIGRTMADTITPAQGPEYSRMDDEMAKILVQACGVKVAYSLALALQTFAAANDNSDPLVIDQQACYALANAIMQYIPKEYVEPELPPPPPPNAGPPSPEQEAARARIRAIQEGSKPTTSFRE